MPKQSSRTALFVAVIAAVAVGLSLISYEYSTIAAERMLDIAAQDARSNAQIQAHDLSAVLAKQLESVSNDQEVIADAKLVQIQDVEGATPLFTAAQGSTAGITQGYSWLDKDGKLLWSTAFSNATLRQQYVGSDWSYREYYSQPKETLRPYYSTLIESADGKPRLYIGYPIIGKEIGVDNESTFRGVIIASINVDKLGTLVQDQLVSHYKSSIGLLDRNGIILYSSSTPQNIGKNIFGPEIQNLLPSDVKEPFNEFVKDSLKGNADSGDFTSQGRTSTIAYEPVSIRGNDFAIMYIVTPHELAGNAVTLIDQQRMLNLITIIAIGVVATTMAAVVMVWYKRLAKEVNAKTSELKFANESLTESNRQLHIANSKLGEANEQLKVHDKLQNEFINVAAHELRTPIQPLLGAAELLESQFNEKDDIKVTKPEIEMILRNAKRLERLSSDILEISRIESGALKLNKENFSLAYIIADAVKDAKAQSNFDTEKLAITYCPDDIFVHADKEKVTEVITNLLTNAIKFTKEGKISITTQRTSDNGTVIIAVRDSGAGIDPEVMPKLFEKFVTKSEKGTGIGLYISKNIIEAHGGTILGENNLDASGATFKFTLPLANKDLEQGKDTELAS